MRLALGLGRRVSAVPHESMFLRAFATFAGERLPEFVRQWLIKSALADTNVVHISRNSRTIAGRKGRPQA